MFEMKAYKGVYIHKSQGFFPASLNLIMTKNNIVDHKDVTAVTRGLFFRAASLHYFLTCTNE